MGWSCNRDAGIMLDIITEACLADTGVSNVYRSKGKKYMIETSNKEHRDGAITGKVWRFDGPDSMGTIKPAGSFRIEGNGRVSRGPSFMREQQWLALEIDGRLHGAWIEHKQGKPSEDALWTQVHEFGKSFEKGGVNFHISEARGHIAYPTKARIVNIDGETVVEWKAPAFQVW